MAIQPSSNIWYKEHPKPKYGFSSNGHSRLLDNTYRLQLPYNSLTENVTIFPEEFCNNLAILSEQHFVVCVPLYYHDSWLLETPLIHRLESTFFVVIGSAPAAPSQVSSEEEQKRIAMRKAIADKLRMEMLGKPQ